MPKCRNEPAKHFLVQACAVKHDRLNTPVVSDELPKAIDNFHAVIRLFFEGLADTFLFLST